ncbi:MAG: OsmC family protein [Candidatus Thorarchaeota archaeon]
MVLQPRYPKRMDFQARSRWTRNGGLILEVGKTQIRFDQKAGSNEANGHPCPYELFIGAIGSCIINTFLDMISRRDLSVAELDFQTLISIQLKGKKYEVASIAIKATIDVPLESQQIAKKYAELALEYCALVDLVRKGAVLSAEFDIRTTDT